MKRSLLKTLLAAAALFAGSSVASADEITATLDYTGASFGDANKAYTSTLDAEKEHFNNTNFGKAWGGAAYAKFAFTLPEGAGVQSATLDFTVLGSGKKRTYDVMVVDAGVAFDSELFAAGNSRIDLAASTVIGNYTANASADNAESVNVTEAVKTMVAAGQNYIIFKWTNNAGGGDLYGKGSDKAPVLKITTADASSLVDYTIKYVDAAGTELKAPRTDSGAAGSTATASEEDMAPITVDGVKYIYESGNQEITLTSGENVITLVFRQASTFNWTLNMLSPEGATLATNTGTVVEGETAAMPYYKYNLLDGTLYTKDATNRQYRIDVQNVEADINETVTYAVSDITDAVFYAEGENLEGATLCTTDNAAVRASNAKVGYNSTDGLAITTLQPGKYILKVGVFKAGNTDFTMNFTCGEATPSITSTTVNLSEAETEEFTLTAASELKMQACGDKNNGLDYIIVRKTGDVEPVVPATTSYTINFLDAEAKVLKEAVTVADQQVGAKVKAADEYLANITVGEVTYKYVSGNDEITLVEDAAANQIKLVFEAEAIPADKTTSYTINFLDTEGNVIKEAVTVENQEVATIVKADDEYLADITVDDVTYKYVSGNDAITLVKDPAENQIKLVFEAEKPAPVENPAWTLNFVDAEGNVLGSKTGTVAAGESQQVTFSRFIAKDGKLYGSSAINKTYAYTFEALTEDATYDIAYAAMEIEGTALLAVEGEDLEGMNVSSEGAVGTRASNCAIGYNAESDVVITALEPGKYKFYIGAFNGASGDRLIAISAGETPILDTKTSRGNYHEITTDEFLLKEACDLKFLKGGATNIGLDFIAVVKTGDVDLSKTTTYTIKFTDAQGTELKEAIVREGLEGDEVSAKDDDLVSFTVNEVRYNYVSGNTPLVLGSDAAANVITLVFAPAQQLEWTLNMVDAAGTVLKSTTGTAYDGETVVAPFSRYLLANGVLYKTDALNKEFRKSFVLTAEATAASVEYTATEVNGAVYCEEGENIEGLSASSKPNVDVRASNAAIGYKNKGDEGVTITTLQPGNYKLMIGTFNANSSSVELVFNAGPATVSYADTPKAGFQEAETETFDVDEATDLTLQTPFGGSTQGLDYLVVVRLGESTGVEGIAIDADDDTPLYNIYGQRVTRDYRGIVIKNGKKFYNKK